MSSKPWNKCDYFYENKRIITIHSVFLAFYCLFFLGGHSLYSICMQVISAIIFSKLLRRYKMPQIVRTALSPYTSFCSDTVVAHRRSPYFNSYKKSSGFYQLAIFLLFLNNPFGLFEGIALLIITQHKTVLLSRAQSEHSVPLTVITVYAIKQSFSDFFIKSGLNGS